MAQEMTWRKHLKDWSPLTFDDYRNIILNQKCSIIQTEVHREIATYPLLECLSLLELEGAEGDAFSHEFLLRL